MPTIPPISILHTKSIFQIYFQRFRFYVSGSSFWETHNQGAALCLMWYCIENPGSFFNLWFPPVNALAIPRLRASEKTATQGRRYLFAEYIEHVKGNHIIYSIQYFGNETILIYDVKEHVHRKKKLYFKINKVKSFGCLISLYLSQPLSSSFQFKAWNAKNYCQFRIYTIFNEAYGLITNIKSLWIHDLTRIISFLFFFSSPVFLPPSVSFLGLGPSYRLPV